MYNYILRLVFFVTTSVVTKLNKCFLFYFMAFYL